MNVIPWNFFNWHAGISETSKMLYLRPDMVRMDKAEQPKITFTARMKKLQELVKEYPELYVTWDALFTAPEETGKGGASHELSSNGIWCLSDPKKASREKGKKDAESMIEAAVKFINAWKLDN